MSTYKSKIYKSFVFLYIKIQNNLEKVIIYPKIKITRHRKTNLARGVENLSRKMEITVKK